MDFYIYDDILNTIWITDKKLLDFKLSKLDQNLHVDKTGFPRPGHIYTFICYVVLCITKAEFTECCMQILTAYIRMR